MIKCYILGCDNEAEVWDDMDNKICIPCMEREIEEESTLPEDYESLTNE